MRIVWVVIGDSFDSSGAETHSKVSGIVFELIDAHFGTGSLRDGHFEDQHVQTVAIPVDNEIRSSVQVCNSSVLRIHRRQLNGYLVFGGAGGGL